MAEQEPTAEELAAIACQEEESNPNYKPPAQKSLQEIQELDKDDESLRKYKEALLGKGAEVAVVDPSAPNVQVTRMTLVCDQAPNPLVLDLTVVTLSYNRAGELGTLEVLCHLVVSIITTGDLDGFKKNPFVLKEGVEYKIKINFKVNKEIVSGLKYTQQSFRKGIKVDKTDYMVGSYGPRPNQEYEFLTTMEEAPKGMMARGTYNIKSKFTDDDKHNHLSWDWSLTIKKD